MAEQRPQAKMTLAGRVALVTGGAKRIGRAVALQLAQEGADVALHYRGSDRAAQEVTSEIERLGRIAVAIRADLRDIGQMRRLFDEAGERFGRFDFLVDNARE